MTMSILAEGGRSTDQPPADPAPLLPGALRIVGLKPLPGDVPGRVDDRRNTFYLDDRAGDLAAGATPVPPP